MSEPDLGSEAENSKFVKKHKSTANASKDSDTQKQLSEKFKGLSELTMQAYLMNPNKLEWVFIIPEEKEKAQWNGKLPDELREEVCSVIKTLASMNHAQESVKIVGDLRSYKTFAQSAD